MSDVSGTPPEEPVVPEGADLPDAREAMPDEPLIPPADVVIPPPPPEIPIPEGLLAEPASDIPSDVSSVDAVVPPPPATRRGSDRARPTPAILEGEPPAAVADDWSQPSVAPEAPTSGGYRVLTVVIFAFLFVLLVAAIIVGVYLLNTTTFPFAGADALPQSILTP